MLTDAFEAGRAIGREEASADLRAKIEGLLSVGHGRPPEVSKTAVKTESKSNKSSKRAVSGSVRPTIAKLIIDSGKAGMSQDEIAEQTGFKHNSIRGTLWSLGNDKLAVKRDGRWFAVAEKETAG